MLRAVLALGGTAAGLAAILSFKTHPADTASAGSASAVPSSPSPAGSPSAAGKSAASKPGAKTRTITGAVESTQFGPMQVAVTLAGKRITGVQVLRQTTDGPVSQKIDAMSIPKLTREALAAQSAQIDTVSGATYTSEGYKQSLQSALDKA